MQRWFGPPRKSIEASAGSLHEPKSKTLDSLLSVIRDGAHTVVLTTVATLTAATALAFLLPTTYTAAASFVPPASSSGSGASALLAQLSSAGAGLGQLGGKSQGDFYVAF